MVFLLFISDCSTRFTMNPVQSLSTHFPCFDDDVFHTRTRYTQYLRDELVFFYFCLTRNQDGHRMEALYQRLHGVLSLFQYLQNQGKDSLYQEIFVQFYKMIGHTRDYFLGKGEHQMSYFLLWVWYDHYPHLVEDAIHHFVFDIDNDTAGYGSWRDIKYLCDFLKTHSVQGEEHRLIYFCISLVNKQLDKDVDTWKFSSKAYCPDALSHVAKWIPREKKRFDWLFRKLAVHWIHNHQPYILTTASSSSSDTSFHKALLKCYCIYRKIIASMNKALQTLEIKLCKRQYHEIVPTSVPKFSLARQRSFFLLSSDDIEGNHTKKSAYQKIKTHHYDIHNHYTPVCENTDDLSSGSLNAFYACYSPGYFVKEACTLLSKYDTGSEDVMQHIHYLNLLWKKQTHVVSMFQLSGFLPIVDISSKMNLHNRDPLYNALGMAICVAFYQSGDYSKRILLIDTVPTWVSLDSCDDFVSTVKMVMDVLKHTPSTTCDLYNAYSLVASPLLQQCFHSSPSTNYIKCLFFSYDPILPSMENIHTLFSSQHLILPTFVFWNVYSDFSYCDDDFSIFSELLHDKSNIFLSGTSFYLLRTLQYICQDTTSQTLISSILKQSRLQPMESLCMASFQ